MPSFQVRYLWLYGGLSDVAPFRKHTSRCLLSVQPPCADRTESSDATCCLSVAGRNLLYRLLCKNSSTSLWETDRGSMNRLVHHLWNTFHMLLCILIVEFLIEDRRVVVTYFERPRPSNFLRSRAMGSGAASAGAGGTRDPGVTYLSTA